ncbi:MAG: helix-turn-helix domain-containing protein [Tepidisphaera sp.]
MPKLPCNKCEACGFVTMGEEADEAVHEALRAKLHLMSGSDLRRLRESLGCTQAYLADLCGFASTSISRWESGALLSRSTDKFLRVCFAVPAAREFLLGLLSAPNSPAQVVWGSDELAVPSESGYVAWREHGPEPPSVSLDRFCSVTRCFH